MMNKTILVLINLLFFSAMLVTNFMSATGMINGETQATVSAAYHNLFVPAGYAFSIWILIYSSVAGYLGYVSYLMVNDEFTVRDFKTSTLFIIVNLLNIAWVFTWMYHQIWMSLLIMILLFAVLLLIFFNERIALEDARLSRFIFVIWPFSLYAGWITVALIANAAALFTKLGFRDIAFEQEVTAAAIAAAAVINIFIVWKRNARLFSLVGVWGLAAVGVARLNEGYTSLATVAFAAAGAVFISTLIHGFQNRHQTPFKKDKIWW